MDLTPYYAWLKLAHIVGAFLFVGGHGTSMAVAIRLRREANADRMRAMLDLSAWSLNVAGIGLLVLLVAGIVAGIVDSWFGQAWIWLSIALLVVVGGLMTPLAAIHFNRIRAGLGVRPSRSKPTEPDPEPLPLAEVAALAASRSIDYAVVIGVIGLALILGLMTLKPF